MTGAWLLSVKTLVYAQELDFALDDVELFFFFFGLLRNLYREMEKL